jgi:hypothetical protein
MLNFKGNTGAFLRSAMGALTLFGLMKNTGPMMQKNLIEILHHFIIPLQRTIRQ